MDGYLAATQTCWQDEASDNAAQIVADLYQVLETIRSITDRVSAVTALDWYSPAGTKFRGYVEEQRGQLLHATDIFQDAVNAAGLHSSENARVRLGADF